MQWNGILQLLRIVVMFTGGFRGGGGRGGGFGRGGGGGRGGRGGGFGGRGGGRGLMSLFILSLTQPALNCEHSLD